MHKKPHPGDILRTVMHDAGLSANSLARKSGVPQPTITRILNKESADPENNTREKIARALDMTVSQLRGEKAFGVRKAEQTIPHYEISNVESITKVRRVPLIEWEQAQSPSSAPQPFTREGITVVTTREVSEQAFALKIIDDTMENPAGTPSFPKGASIIIDPTITPKSGDYVVYASQSGVTFKQLVIDGGRRFLKPLNPRYPIIEATPEGSVRGVLVQLIMDF